MFDGQSARLVLSVATTVVGVLTLVAFVLVERRSPHPLVPPAL